MEFKMSTKKILILGLALTLMSPLASYAKVGGESGGGGDAVMVDGKVILRDLELGSQATKIQNNLEFMNSISGFRKLITKLAQVNTTFAFSVINELNTVTLYKSVSSLPLLPYSVTTISGKGATIQLATRINYEVILAPEFFENSQQELIILHEALHGLLSENSGPLHHQRVRNIVRYIYENLDTLNTDSLNAVLAENYFYNQYAQTNDEKSYEDIEAAISYAFDKDNHESLRCYMAQRNYKTEFLVDYLNLKCEKKLESENNYEVIERDQNLENFLNIRFSELVKLRGYKYSLETSSLYFSSFELAEDKPKKFFESKITKINREYVYKMETGNCRELKEELEKQTQRQESLQKVVKMRDLYYETLNDKSLKRSERDALLDGNFIPFSFFRDFNKELDGSVDETNETVKEIMNLQKLCKQKYPKL